MSRSNSKGHFFFHFYLTQNLADGKKQKSMLQLGCFAGNEKMPKRRLGFGLFDILSLSKGLTALDKVVKALNREDVPLRRVPYSDSVVTRLVKNAFGGAARTGVIVHCSLADEHMAETLTSLKFARLITNIKNCGKRSHKVAQIFERDLRQVPMLKSKVMAAMFYDYQYKGKTRTTDKVLIEEETYQDQKEFRKKKDRRNVTYSHATVD